MDLVLIELILWGGLLFFFWAMKEGLGSVETDLESLSLIRRGRAAPRHSHFYQPECVAECIGSYQDAPIFRYALIQGNTYQFDRVCPVGCTSNVDDAERYVAPGLVYQECSAREWPEPVSTPA